MLRVFLQSLGLMLSHKMTTMLAVRTMKPPFLVHFPSAKGSSEPFAFLSSLSPSSCPSRDSRCYYPSLAEEAEAWYWWVQYTDPVYRILMPVLCAFPRCLWEFIQKKSLYRNFKNRSLKAFQNIVSTIPGQSSRNTELSCGCWVWF